MVFHWRGFLILANLSPLIEAKLRLIWGQIEASNENWYIKCSGTQNLKTNDLDVWKSNKTPKFNFEIRECQSDNASLSIVAEILQNWYNNW